MQKLPGAILATNVMPSFCASFSESDVGTDFAATAAIPIRPSFIIISEEQRPL